MEIIRTGEITALGRIIDPEIAKDLGDTALAVYREYCKQNYLYGDGTLYPADTPANTDESLLAHRGTNIIYLSPDNHDLYLSLLGGFRNRARRYVECEEPTVSAEFYFGRAAGGRWHIDGAFDYRELINLSEFPISLLVAHEWSGTGLGEGWLNTVIEPGVEPAAYTGLDYSPGEGVGINNFCPISEQVPHLGSSEDDKVFFRMIATNPDGSDLLRTTL